MTVTLNQSDFWELFESVKWSCIEVPNSSYWEESCPLPALLGQGCLRVIALCDELSLCISTWEHRNVHAFHFHEREHEVEMCFEIPVYQRCQNSYSTLFGSGIAPQTIEVVPAGGQSLKLSVSFEPTLIKTLYMNSAGELPPELQLLIKPDDWQLCLHNQKVTLPIHRIIQQIVTCPYQGLTKQMYLQAKALELLALQIEALQIHPESKLSTRRLTRSTLNGIDQARAILLADLEHPPSILELAQQVGLSDRTLRRGFRQLFGTTVIGYLTDKRLEQAERLLREQDHTVAEVARLVGYATSSHFAAAFKRKFGLTPQACWAGKKSVLR
jgi:AraC-like DNA-binding protein